MLEFNFYFSELFNFKMLMEKLQQTQLHCKEILCFFIKRTRIPTCVEQHWYVPELRL